MALNGTWCTKDDVPTFAGGISVSDDDVNLAQVIIEATVRRVWRVTDSTTRDYYWLQRAVALQAAYLHQHPEVATLMDVQSMSQDGLSISARQDTTLHLAPLARLVLQNLFRGSNTTIRLNSAFQKNRVRQGSVPGGTMPWRGLE